MEKNGQNVEALTFTIQTYTSFIVRQIIGWGTGGNPQYGLGVFLEFHS